MRPRAPGSANEEDSVLALAKVALREHLHSTRKRHVFDAQRLA